MDNVRVIHCVNCNAPITVEMNIFHERLDLVKYCVEHGARDKARFGY